MHERGEMLLTSSATVNSTAAVVMLGLLQQRKI